MPGFVHTWITLEEPGVGTRNEQPGAQVKAGEFLLGSLHFPVKLLWLWEQPGMENLPLVLWESNFWSAWVSISPGSPGGYLSFTVGEKHQHPVWSHCCGGHLSGGWIIWIQISKFKLSWEISKRLNNTYFLPNRHFHRFPPCLQNWFFYIKGIVL